MKKPIVLICIILIICILFISGCSSLKACFPSGKCISLEIMETADEKATGLMFRELISDSEGMLFLNSNNARSCMWMKNMNFAIDIVWLDENSTISYIETDVLPCAKEPCDIYCHDAKDVLELQAGFAKAYGLHAMDAVAIK